MTGVELIAAERQRQISVEGWTAEHDREHSPNALAKAAACYALPASIRSKEIWGIPLLDFLWPFDAEWWKPGHPSVLDEQRIRELSKAGALVAAEIDRLQSHGGPNASSDQTS